MQFLSFIRISDFMYDGVSELWFLNRHSIKICYAEKKNDCLTCHQKSTDLLINAKSYCYVLLWNVLFFRFHFYRIWTGDLWQNARHLKLKYPSSFRIISCVFYLISFLGLVFENCDFRELNFHFSPPKVK